MIPPGFIVIRFENRNGVTSWHMAVWLHGVSIRKNFPTREETAAEKSTLEIKAAQTANGMRTVAITHRKNQVREAEFFFRRVTALPRTLSFYVDFAKAGCEDPQQPARLLSMFFKYCFQRVKFAKNPIPKVPPFRIRRKRGLA